MQKMTKAIDMIKMITGAVQTLKEARFKPEYFTRVTE